MDKATDFQFLQ